MSTTAIPATAVRRYALVGAGGRAGMFLEPLATNHRDGNQIVGLCDTNPGRRMFHQNELVQAYGYARVPTYGADDFERMIRDTQPDVVIVATVDAFHHHYAIAAMERGCDVIVEKPMTIDAAKCRAMLDAVQRTGRRCRVTFNYRWGPGPTRVRRLLSEGVIGEVLHVDMEYLLNTWHGASYFRRWHREKDKSGGLMVHKSTHHFDLVNWWLDAAPESVFGFGRRAFYGRDNALRRGIDPDAGTDPFNRLVIHDPRQRALYLENRAHDGYTPDRNVFDDHITAEDTMSVLVKYRTGVVLNYSLNAYLPREGFHVVFNGDRGRLEYREDHSIDLGTNTEGQAVIESIEKHQCIVHPMFSRPYEVPIQMTPGGHGGGDPLIQEQMFSRAPKPDPWGRSAGHEQGAASILIGIAANESFARGAPVTIADLCPHLGDRTRLRDLT